MTKGVFKTFLLISLFVFAFTSLSVAKLPAGFSKEGSAGPDPASPAQKPQNAEELNSAGMINADDASLIYKRGTQKENQGQTEEAIEDFSKAIALNPTNGVYFFTRYNSYFASGRYQLALQDITKAIELKKTSPGLDSYKELFSNRGWLHLQMGNYDKAFEDYNQATKIDPEALLSYPFVFDMDSDRFNEYLKFLDKMISVRPTDARLLFTRSELYTEIKDYDNAIYDLSKAIEFDPGNNYYYYYRGYLCLEKGIIQQAKLDFQRICNSRDATESFKQTVERACKLMTKMEQEEAGSTGAP